ncbi:ester cyclase [Aureibaculum luteum]|uniref:ester cyclase n=1 Tax=Aureibaculum luteum TaxID=1548456 RepID=UPI000E5200D4|nr:ester cyclase [Aureibaculum luteum]
MKSKIVILLVLLSFILSISIINCKGSIESKITSDTIANNCGKKYAKAWSGQDTEAYSKIFTSNGSLKVDNEKPVVGRDAISKVAQSYITAFPDMIVALDSLVKTTKGIEFYWTLTGTNIGPKGTGKKVNISGFEVWKLDNNGLIKEPIGSFDTN